jgi:hypothetical protein
MFANAGHEANEEQGKREVQGKSLCWYSNSHNEKRTLKTGMVGRPYSTILEAFS